MVVIFHRGLRVSSRHLFLTLGDWSAIVLAQLSAVYLRLGFDVGHEYLLDNWGSLVGAVLIYVLVFYAGGMYEPPTRTRRVDFDFLPLVVTGIAAGLTGLVLYARPQMTLGRGIWMISSVLILWLTYGLRRLFLQLVRHGFFLRKALLLCDHPDRAADLLHLLNTNASSLYHVAGLVVCGASSASAYPDGLEWSIGKVTGGQELSASGPVYSMFEWLQSRTAVMPDYSTGAASEAVSTSGAGLIGGAIVLALAAGTAFVLSKVKKKK